MAHSAARSTSAVVATAPATQPSASPSATRAAAKAKRICGKVERVDGIVHLVRPAVAEVLRHPGISRVLSRINATGADQDWLGDSLPTEPLRRHLNPGIAGFRQHDAPPAPRRSSQEFRPKLTF